MSAIKLESRRIAQDIFKATSRGWWSINLICLLIIGCRASDTIWSTEARSPDDQWIANARMDQYGGFGSAGIQSFVTLKRSKGPNDVITIFQLSQDTTMERPSLHWNSPTDLEITYKQPASIDFEAVRCGGISITIHDVTQKK